ncbi:Cyclic AMP-responsive element-binding protein 1 [Thelohanellus kitauei]|uniref:Cyclic AMP-responsive element-binding protein 1 n=1 Tax=Thelohanellus kitauei TaxID=669202 RepID=A0A0C2I7C0_THEKT|nr:Cyclic AMP-responsive element-binding protein 1 [Thelohanellus kitauei]
MNQNPNSGYPNQGSQRSPNDYPQAYLGNSMNHQPMMTYPMMPAANNSPSYLHPSQAARYCTPTNENYLCLPTYSPYSPMFCPRLPSCDSSTYSASSSPSIVPAGAVEVDNNTPNNMYINTSCEGYFPSYVAGNMSTLPAQPAQMTQAEQIRASELERKRQIRLAKNRKAAKQCRIKRRDYVKNLEERVCLLESQNAELVVKLKNYMDKFGNI